LAEEESLHRRDLEMKANDANISAQQYQLRIAEQQSRAVFRSDLLGQIAGFIVCLACIGAAVYLGLNGHDWLAGMLALIPTGALIRASVLNRKPKLES
jgi:fatty acid desaturase